jgi:hypothetical protein
VSEHPVSEPEDDAVRVDSQGVGQFVGVRAVRPPVVLLGVPEKHEEQFVHRQPVGRGRRADGRLGDQPGVFGARLRAVPPPRQTERRRPVSGSVKSESAWPFGLCRRYDGTDFLGRGMCSASRFRGIDRDTWVFDAALRDARR